MNMSDVAEDVGMLHHETYQRYDTFKANGVTANFGSNINGRRRRPSPQQMGREGVRFK